MFITPATKGVISKARRIGQEIGASEAIYLRLHLGRDPFDAFMIVFGVKAGQNHPTLMEIGPKYPGLPAIGTAFTLVQILHLGPCPLCLFVSLVSADFIITRLTT